MRREKLTVKKMIINTLDKIEIFLAGIESYRDANNDGEFILDTNVGYYITEDSSLDIIVSNVLNNEYSLRPGIPEAPRNYAIRYSLKIN